MDVAIYCLKAINGEIRYVGKANKPATRLKGHIRDMHRRDTPLYSWMRRECSAGRAPTIEVLEWCAVENWPERERHWIAALNDSCRLLNLAEGGEQPYCPPGVRVMLGPKATKARQSSPLKRRVWELNRNIGQLLREGHVTDAAKAKLRLAAKLRPELFGRWEAI